MHRFKSLLACLVIGAASITLGAMSALHSSFLESAKPLTGLSFFIGSGVPLENQEDLIPGYFSKYDQLDEDRISCSIVGLNIRLKIYSEAELDLCEYMSRYSAGTKLNWKQVVQRKGDNILSLSPGLFITSGKLNLGFWDELRSRAWGVELPVIWTHKFPVIADDPKLKISFNACAKATYARNKMFRKDKSWSPDHETRYLGTADVFTGSVGGNIQFRGKHWALTPELVIRLIPIGDNKFKGKPGFGVSLAWLSDRNAFERD